MLALIVAARAQEVLHAELTADEALRQVSSDAGVARDALSPVTVSVLLRGRSPVTTGAATLSPCGGAFSPSDLRDAAARAQRRILDGDDDGATREVDAALARLGCLREGVVAADVARLLYLRGVAWVDLGDADAARLAFADAVGVDPATTWDLATFGPVGSDVFAAAAPEPDVLFRVIPAPADGALTLDGVAFGAGPDGLPIAPGLHVVQWSPSMGTYALDIRGPATLVLPALATDDLARWAGDPGRGAALVEVLSAWGASDVDYVAVPEATWRRDGDSWTLLREHRQAFVLTPAQRRARTERRVRVGGLVTAGLATVTAATGYAVARSAQRWGEVPLDAAQSPADARAAAMRRFERGEWMLWVGAPTAGVGALVAGATLLP